MNISLRQDAIYKYFSITKIRSQKTLFYLFLICNQISIRKPLRRHSKRTIDLNDKVSEHKVYFVSNHKIGRYPFYNSCLHLMNQ